MLPNLSERDNLGNIEQRLDGKGRAKLWNKIEDCRMKEDIGRRTKRVHKISACIFLLLLLQAARQADCDSSSQRMEPSPESSSRVAAFATKLEHWLACRRFSSPSPAPSLEPAAELYGSGPRVASPQVLCPAHFDGHLCWPPSRAGSRVRVPCPRLRWLLEDGASRSEESSMDLIEKSPPPMSMPESINLTSSESKQAGPSSAVTTGKSHMAQIRVSLESLDTRVSSGAIGAEIIYHYWGRV